jgi:DHA2 family multidrug resistance protein
MVANFVHEDPEILASNKGLAEAQRKNVDWIGIGLMSMGLAALQYFLEEGQRDDWFHSRVMTCICLFAVAALVAFVIRELTAKVPAVNLRLFKDKVFLSGTMIGAVMFAMLLANMFLLPIFMQELLGFTATQSGIALMPRVLVMIAITPIIGKIYNVVSPRLIIAVGVVAFAVGAYQMSHLTLQSGEHDVIGAILVQGIGFSCLFVPLTTAALSSTPKHQMPDATGLNSLLRQIGGSIGLAIFATLLNSYQVHASASLSANLSITRPEVQQRVMMIQRGLAARGMDAVTARAASFRAMAGTVYRQAAVLAFDKIFLLAGILFLLVLPLLIFLKVSRDGPTVEAHVDI